MSPAALSHLRVCDLTGQWAGAGATRYLAAMGADVIRVEDPVREGKWDILRGAPPFIDDRRGNELGGAFNNHNVNKRGVTINLKHRRGKDLLRRLVALCDVVCENFTAGVMDSLGFGYECLKEIRPDIIYVSNCGFGHAGPYAAFRSWGSIVQACSGLTFTSGLPNLPPAGWGYSYMDHHGGNFQAMAIQAALIHRGRTGEGMWIDMSCTDAGATMLGPAILDFTVNGRRMRRPGMPHSNHSQWPVMVPHNIYPSAGSDNWVAIAVRNDDEWMALATEIPSAWAQDPDLRSLAGRADREEEIDMMMTEWTGRLDREEVVDRLRAVGVVAAPVTRPDERIDGDPFFAEEWGLWPWVTHPEIGSVHVDGLPLHFSETDWAIKAPAMLLGQHNEEVFCGMLGLTEGELTELRTEGAI